MDYLDLHQFLKKSIHKELDTLPLGDGLQVTHLDFTSDNFKILPGEDRYACIEHGALEGDGDIQIGKPAIPAGFLHLEDSHVLENRAFRYAVFHQAEGGRAQGVLLLFHGLNEKDWFKYFPWAYRLAKTTGKAVVLFPLAFHMNRTLHEWSDHRLMHRASEERRKAFPEIISSSLSNVAISTRLHTWPQRFLWSGIQTYYDVVQFLKMIRAGRHPLLAPGASVDILAYSIGCLLAQVLMMANPEHLFETSRLAMFCGGAVFNRMSPVSKFILDSKANVALYSCLVEHLESYLRDDPRLRHYLSEDHPEGVRFRSMLNYRVMREERETEFRRLAPRLLGVSLDMDTVVPPYEVINTLQGSKRDIPVPVKVMDFPYKYQHEDPFPLLQAHRDEVDLAFRQVFDTIGAFYSA